MRPSIGAQSPTTPTFKIKLKEQHFYSQSQNLLILCNKNKPKEIDF